MANESQAGNMNRSHSVGCPALRDRTSPICFCNAPLPAPVRPIREDSAVVYQNIAGFRKILALYPNLPADLLREMLEKTLVAAELLLQATDRMQDCVEALQAIRG
jgi:hypothetical protein